MDEFGFDEAGNYIAGGWDPSDAENVHANDEIDWDGGDWDGVDWYAGAEERGRIRLLFDVHEMFFNEEYGFNDVEYVREEEEEDWYDLGWHCWILENGIIRCDWNPRLLFDDYSTYFDEDI